MKVSNYSPSGMGLQVKNKVKISLPWENKTSIPLLSELRKQARLYKKIKSKSTSIITLQVASSGFPGWPYQLLEAAGCWGDCSLPPFPPAEAHSVLKRWLRRHIKVRKTGNLLGSFPDFTPTLFHVTMIQCHAFSSVVTLIFHYVYIIMFKIIN